MVCQSEIERVIEINICVGSDRVGLKFVKYEVIVEELPSRLGWVHGQRC